MRMKGLITCLPACLSAAGCLWAGVWRFVLMCSVWVVQFDMDEASDCQYIDYYSVYTFNIHVPYLIVLTNQNQALVTLCLHAYLNFINCELYAAYWWPMI